MDATSNMTNFSSNSSSPAESPEINDPLHIVSSGVSSKILMYISGFLTLSTLLCILLHKKLRTPNNIIPFNIVLCDFLVIAVRISYQINDSNPSIVYSLIFSSDLTSVLNILLAALHQFITIRVDPFGTRNIITTPRIFAACIITWLLPLPTVAFFFWWTDDWEEIYNPLLFSEIGLLILTGFFYAFVYRTIAGGSSTINFSEQRKRENRKIFATIALIYVTTLVFRIIFTIGYSSVFFPKSSFMFLIGINAYYLSTLSNALVYWWRLKEFRSILPKCREASIDVLK